MNFCMKTFMLTLYLIAMTDVSSHEDPGTNLTMTGFADRYFAIS